MKKVDGFLTFDNKYFDDEKDAELHERKLNFVNWYAKLDAKEKPSGGKSDSVAVFIQKNAEVVLELLNVKR